MGIIKSGILGGFSGNVGNVVGSTWKGIDYMKSLPQSVKNPRTVLQVAQRLRMKTIVLFSQFFLNAWIQKLWNGAAVKMSGFNAFVKANLPAVSAAGVIDITKIIGASGPMAAVEITAAAYTAGTRTLVVTFPTAVDGETQSANDVAHILVVDTILKKGAAASGALRSTGTISIILPEDIGANAIGSTVFLAFKGNEPLIRPVQVSDSSKEVIVAAI